MLPALLLVSALLALPTALPAAIAPAATPVLAPTRNGDRVGTASMTADGGIVMQLRSVDCDGRLAEARVGVLPGDRNYAATLASLDGLAAGGVRPVIARGLLPCPARAHRHHRAAPG